jgi:hypothetical protein
VVVRTVVVTVTVTVLVLVLVLVVVLVLAVVVVVVPMLDMHTPVVVLVRLIVVGGRGHDASPTAVW